MNNKGADQTARMRRLIPAYGKNRFSHDVAHILLSNMFFTHWSLHFQLDFKMDGRTILHMACHEGYLDLIKFLLREGADVKDQDDEGDTPLHYAAFGYGFHCFLNRHATVFMKCLCYWCILNN